MNTNPISFTATSVTRCVPAGSLRVWRLRWRHRSWCQRQQPLDWDQVKAKFEAVNPALKADADNVDEMKAEEITAFLRPNPQFTLSVDGTQAAPHNGVWTPFKGTTEQPNFSYLHERDHKRELRLESAQEGTRITQSQHEDLERNMVFALRTAFVATLAGQVCAGSGQGRP